jgi:hypothetical protein
MKIKTVKFWFFFSDRGRTKHDLFFSTIVLQRLTTQKTKYLTKKLSSVDGNSIFFRKKTLVYTCKSADVTDFVAVRHLNFTWRQGSAYSAQLPGYKCSCKTGYFLRKIVLVDMLCVMLFAYQIVAPHERMLTPSASFLRSQTPQQLPTLSYVVL